MTTQEIAYRLIELCNEGNYEQAQNELYHPDVLSVERPVIENEMMQYSEMKGMDSLVKKAKMWIESMEELINQGTIGDPIIVDNAFAVHMFFKAIMKGETEPVVMKEIALYHVQDGKIVREEFIY